MQSYRRLWAIPGVPTTMLLMFFARIPSAGANMALTLHVAIGMHRGYAAAGLVGAAGTIGIAIGGPVLGRIIDRYGLRRLLVIVTLGEAAFWFPAPMLPYPALLVCSLVGGLVVLPAMSIGRQAMTALVPEQSRRAALSLDSIGVELTFMVAPALSVFVATQFSTTAALLMMGVATVFAGIALYLVDPKVVGEQEEETAEVSRRSWLTPAFGAVLVAAAGVVFVLAGQEVALVAHLRSHGQLGWSGLVIAAMCVASALGGLLHGAAPRALGLFPLLALLAVSTMPAGLFGGTWWVLAITLGVANLACAASITATGEQVARLAPPAARGVAMGLQGSALTVGAAMGAPLIGLVVDRTNPTLGFVMAGVGGLLLFAVAVLLSRTGFRRPPHPPAGVAHPDEHAAGRVEPAPSG